MMDQSAPGRAVIRYAIPMPGDSPISEQDMDGSGSEEVALSGSRYCLSSNIGGPAGIRTLDTRIKSPVL